MASIDLKIFQKVPFLSHCNNYELRFLAEVSEKRYLKLNSTLDLRKDESFYIVEDGILEYTNITGKNESFYFNHGSFFGEIPFCENRLKGSLRALSNSVLIRIEKENLFKMFFFSYRGSRGYLKSLDMSGFLLSSTGKKYIANKTKVLTVYSPFSNSGKSLMASLLAVGMENSGKTIVLDLSYNGNSIFDNFELKLTPAISQRSEPQKPDINFLNQNIQQVGENLSLLNISFGSKVKMNKDIISPILFLLSDRFSNIIIDLSGEDIELCEEVFKFSDYIFPLLKKQKQFNDTYKIIDESLNDGQKVIYLLNSFYSSFSTAIDGAYVIPKLRVKARESVYSRLRTLVNDDKLFDFLFNMIGGKKTGLVLYSQSYLSLYAMGLYTLFMKNEVLPDFILSTDIGYVISSLFLLSKSEKDFVKICGKLFNENRLNLFAEVCFPEKYVFKNNKIHSFMHGVAKGLRAESLKTTAICSFSDKEGLRNIKSSGNLKDLMTASMSVNPLFEPVEIGKKELYSGFPHNNVRAADFLRNHVDRICFFAVNSPIKRRDMFKNLMPFYKDFLDFYSRSDHIPVNENISTNIILNLDETNREDDIIKSISDIENKWEGQFKKAGLDFADI